MSIIGDIKGDTRSLDYNSYRLATILNLKACREVLVDIEGKGSVPVCLGSGLLIQNPRNKCCYILKT